MVSGYCCIRETFSQRGCSCGNCALLTACIRIPGALDNYSINALITVVIVQCNDKTGLVLHNVENVACDVLALIKPGTAFEPYVILFRLVG